MNGWQYMYKSIEKYTCEVIQDKNKYLRVRRVNNLAKTLVPNQSQNAPTNMDTDWKAE